MTTLQEERARRDREIYKLRSEEGLKVGEIAVQYGLSGAAVRRILEGFPPVSQARAAGIRTFSLAADSGSIEEATAATGLSKATLRKHLRRTEEGQALLETWRTKRRSPQWYTDAELIAVLQEAGKALGEPLSGPLYEQWRKGRELPSGQNYPTRQTIFKRFGSWVEALRAAGVASLPSTAVGVRVEWTADDITELIGRLWDEDGRPPKASAFDTSDPNQPSTATIRNRFGTWNSALRATAEKRLDRKLREEEERHEFELVAEKGTISVGRAELEMALAAIDQAPEAVKAWLRGLLEP